MIEGSLNKTCEILHILAPTLRYYLGQEVPDLKESRGGYRAKSAKSYSLRKNTIGWMLSLHEGE